jgi:hypothetical protein
MDTRLSQLALAHGGVFSAGDAFPHSGEADIVG